MLIRWFELAKKDTIKFAARIKEEAKKQEAIENERAANLDNLLRSLSSKLNELKEHKVKLTEKYETQTKKEIEDSEQIINEQKKEIRKLKLQNVKKENKIREEKRIEFINQKIKVWRKKTWILFFIFALLFLIGIIGIIVSCNGDTSAANNKLEELFANRFVSIVASIIIAFVNIFIIKLLYDKYYNYSNIENYKKNIKIPEEYFPLQDENDLSDM